MRRLRVVPMALAAVGIWGCATEDDDRATTPNASEPQLEESSNGLPPGFVRVPGGATHRSCVHEVPSGATISSKENGVDVLVDDVVVAHYPSCGFTPMLSRPGRARPTPLAAAPLAAAAAATSPGTVNWLEDAYQYAPFGRRWDAVNVDMRVPAHPERNVPAKLYYFPGLESSLDDNCGLLQPVLQWGVSAAGGGVVWNIGSWWAKSDGTFMHSSLSRAETGDLIHTSMTYSPKGRGSWLVSAQNPRTGGVVALRAESSGSTCRYDRVFGAVLEGYQSDGGVLPNCSGLPHNYIEFTNISLRDDLNQGVSYSPSYELYRSGPKKPVCGWGFGSSVAGNSTTLWSSLAWTGDPQPTDCGHIPPGKALVQGRSFSSCDGRFTLWMQTDGNLVLYWNGVRALWASNTTTGKVAYFQPDGNLVVYTSTVAPPAPWASGTSGHPGANLFVQNDGNLVIYEANGGPRLWDSKTGGH